jgi:hypothetical protein
MSLAHLRIPKVDRSVSPGTVVAVKKAAPLGSYCGATREPIYRTMDEAKESGLEICDSCVADFRRQRKTH